MSVQHQPDVEQQNDEQPEEQTKQKRPRFAQMPHYVLNHPKLNPGDRELYAHLDTYWRSHKDECWPSQETLANKMGVNVCTVHRRAKKLADAKLIEVKRQGLNKPNKYKRLPPPPPDLHIVPAPGGAPDDQPDLAEVQDPDLASMQALDLASVQDEADALEADASEEDKSKSTGVCTSDRGAYVPDSPEDSLHVVKAMEERLLPLLTDADEKTSVTLARIILHGPQRIHEGHIEYIRDKLTGDQLDERYTLIEADNPAAYVCTAFQTFADGRYAGPLPDTYAALGSRRKPQ
jgi:hypothetical protein